MRPLLLCAIGGLILAIAVLLMVATTVGVTIIEILVVLAIVAFAVALFQDSKRPV